MNGAQYVPSAATGKSEAWGKVIDTDEISRQEVVRVRNARHADGLGLLLAEEISPIHVPKAARVQMVFLTRANRGGRFFRYFLIVRIVIWAATFLHSFPGE